MLLNIRALAVAGGVFWGGGVFLIGLGNLMSPSYGVAFLEMAASMYPGYEAVSGFGSVVVGTGYALLDGAVAGAVVAWVYNLVAGRAVSNA